MQLTILLKISTTRSLACSCLYISRIFLNPWNDTLDSVVCLQVISEDGTSGTVVRSPSRPTTTTTTSSRPARGKGGGIKKKRSREKLGHAEVTGRGTEEGMGRKERRKARRRGVGEDGQGQMDWEEAREGLEKAERGWGEAEEAWQAGTPAPPKNRKSTPRIFVICPPPKWQFCEGEGVWFVGKHTKPNTLTLTAPPFFWRRKNRKFTSWKLLRAGCGTKSKARPKAEWGGQGQEGCLSRKRLPDAYLMASHKSWADTSSRHQRSIRSRCRSWSRQAQLQNSV